MQIGDLVEDKKMKELGLGVIISPLEPDLENEIRWAVLWASPTWVMESGCSVAYEKELEVISESR